MRLIRLVVVLLVVGSSSRAPSASPSVARSVAPAARSFTVEVVGSGPPIVLVPGLACSGDVWAGAVKHLRAGHTLHVVTLAGFGGVPAIGAPFLSRVRDDLIQYMRSRHLVRPVVIGHSLGGFLALWIAATAPDLVGGVVAVDGVPFLPALMSPDATVDQSRAMAASIRDRMAGLSREGFAAQNRAALAQMITAPADVDRVAAASAGSDPRAVGLAVYELMTTDLRPAMRRIRAPALLVAAGGGAAPAERAAIAARYEAQVAGIARRRVVVAERARHFVMLDDPDFLFGRIDELLREARR
jgi:pimeloyl-ACP methyl ester carboxylesterase